MPSRVLHPMYAQLTDRAADFVDFGPEIMHPCERTQSCLVLLPVALA